MEATEDFESTTLKTEFGEIDADYTASIFLANE